MRGIDWLFNWTALLLIFVKELAKSVHDVMLNVVTPNRVSKSAIVELPLDVKSDLGIALLANMVTLTPGTTTLHISEDKSCLYAHVMWSRTSSRDSSAGY